jgi:hypothetical protein
LLKLRGLLVAAAVSVAVGAVGMGTAQAGTTTLSLRATEVFHELKDLPPVGITNPGDKLIYTERLTSNGKLVGYSYWTLGFNGTDYPLDAVTTLSGGTLRVHGVMHGLTPPSSLRITGGTGKYAGARGSLTFRPLTTLVTVETYTIRR